MSTYIACLADSRDAGWSEAVTVGNLNFVEEDEERKKWGGDSVGIQSKTDLTAAE